jgi:L,D-transpeptidase ErfK/SrfK
VKTIETMKRVLKRLDRRFLVLGLFVFAIGASPTWSETPTSGDVEGAFGDTDRFMPLVGTESSDLIMEGDTLLDVAVRHRVGFEALSNLNSDVDTWIPVPGSVVRIPSRTILPRVERKGLVINIPEMRLFDFRFADAPRVIAAAVGDAEDPTPIGKYHVGEKRTDPIWYVPKSIREEKPELPAQVPPGPDNPLGSRWLRIGTTSYGIHGTNTRWSIGREATHGCVRLFEDEVQQLYERTPVGTPLEIVYQPYKWGRQGRVIYLEVHPDRYARVSERLAEALAPIRDSGLLDRIDIGKVWRAVDEMLGIPIAVGTLPREAALPTDSLLRD